MLSFAANKSSKSIANTVVIPSVDASITLRPVIPVKEPRLT